MARPISIFLTVSLLIGSALGLRLHSQNQRLRKDRDEWAAAIPGSDPRQKAAELSRTVAAAQQKTAGHLQSLARLAPPPKLAVAVTNEVKPVEEDSAESKRQRVEQLLLQVIDTDALMVLMRDLDPKRTPLPARVEVDPKALAGWTVLRARWPQPIGFKEFEQLRSQLGLSSSLLKLLSPSIAWNVDAVRDSLRRNYISTDEAIAWLATVPGGLDHQSPDPRDFTLPNFKGDAYERFIRQSGQDIWKPWMHDYASSIVDPRLDTLLVQMAGSNQGDTEGMEAIQSFAIWRSVVHDADITPISDALWKNAILPNERLAVSEQVSTSMDMAAEKSYSPKFARYRLELLGGSQGMLGSRNEVLHELEMVPYDSDAFRPVMLALQIGCRMPEKLGDARLQEITASWNDQRHLARLIRMAQVNERADPRNDATQPAVVAIVRLRQINAIAANHVTRFWMSQQQWPEAVHYAFGESDVAGEHALLTAWLCSETLPKPDAVSSAVQTLNFTGGLATVVTMTLHEPSSPLGIVPQPNQKYFLQRATQVVRGISGRDRELMPVVDLEAIKP